MCLAAIAFITIAAANLGFAESLLRKWKKDLDDPSDQAFPGKGNHLPALEEEPRRLRAENKRLQIERVILKKQRPSLPRSRCPRVIRLPSGRSPV